MVLRDKFWLWGHTEGRYNNEFGNTGISRMTPMEGCLYLGVRNTFMVPIEEEVNRRQYNKSFKTLRQVGWECFAAAKNPSAIEQNISEAKDFANIGCVVFDDFCMEGRHKDIRIDDLWAIRERLHTNEVRPLDMWMVLYTHEFGLDETHDSEFQKYIDPFDGIIMWTWKESDVPLIPEKFEKFKAMTPNNRRMAGVYLWNFGEEKQATGTKVTEQLDFWHKKLIEGEIEGIVLHTNTMADLDYEAYDAACAWMDEHGDEVIGK